MAKILVNYVHNKSKDEYEILLGAKYVFATEPIAILDTEDDIKNPLVVPIRGQMVVVDRARYELTNKKFKLASDEEGKVFENPNGAEIWLPKDTDISKLRYINGQLVMIQEEPKEESEKKAEDKPAPKKRETKK